jgi:hypothetical protein
VGWLAVGQRCGRQIPTRSVNRFALKTPFAVAIITYGAPHKSRII